jgi:hypothetical protein
MDDSNQTLDEECRRSTFFQWPVRIFGPVPGLMELNLACWGLFVGFVAVPLFVRLWIQFKSKGGITNILPIDFIYFYGIGRLTNEYPLTRLYDYSLQLKIFNDIYPLHDADYGPSPYPPWVALFFGLFARIPFAQAYLLWMGTSLILYLIGIAVLIKGVFPGKRLEISLVFCFALAFHPFVMNTLANGQLASIAVFSVGLAIFQERRSNPFCSGLALSILTYKPTLLLLIIPMLLLTRRLRTLLGFITGAVVLILVATTSGGIQIWPAYAHFLNYFGKAAGLSGQSVLLSWKYVDFSSLSYAVPGGRSREGLVALVFVTIMIAGWLVMLLWKSSTGIRPAQCLTWAATLTWTMLLNVYVPIYDSVLVTIALILTIGALRDLDWRAAEGWIVALAALIFGVSWVTTSIAKAYGIQSLTILLSVFGLVQLFQLRRAIRQGSPQEERTRRASASKACRGLGDTTTL